MNGFACPSPPVLAPGFPLPAHAFPLCPHSSGSMQYRNFNLLSIDYVFRPRLRPRLTQGRSALPWKPWIFGLEDSHFNLATHSGILSSRQSTTPYGMASSRLQCSSTSTIYPSHNLQKLRSNFQRLSEGWTVFLSFGVVFQPRTFSAQDLSTSELLRTLLMCGCF